MTDDATRHADEKQRKLIFWGAVAIAVVVCYRNWDSISRWMENQKIDPAAWLDSPYVFNTVIGIAAIFVLFSVFTALWVRLRIAKAEAWVGDRSDGMLVSLLNSADRNESTMAYTVLRKRLHDGMTDALLKQLKEMSEPDADPRFAIYLLEDLGASKAAPILRRIMKQRESRPAVVVRAAEDALERIQIAGTAPSGSPAAEDSA